MPRTIGPITIFQGTVLDASGGTVTADSSILAGLRALRVAAVRIYLKNVPGTAAETINSLAGKYKSEGSLAVLSGASRGLITETLTNFTALNIDNGHWGVLTPSYTLAGLARICPDQIYFTATKNSNASGPATLYGYAFLDTLSEGPDVNVDLIYGAGQSSAPPASYDLPRILQL